MGVRVSIQKFYGFREMAVVGAHRRSLISTGTGSWPGLPDDLEGQSRADTGLPVWEMNERSNYLW